MSDPETLEDYNRLFTANTGFHGFGLETEIDMPCPFCAAPHWLRTRVVATERAMKRGATCKECGRSARFVFDIDQPTAKQFHLVQTGGPDIPAYLPPIERVSP